MFVISKYLIARKLRYSFNSMHHRGNKSKDCEQHARANHSGKIYYQPDSKGSKDFIILHTIPYSHHKLFERHRPVKVLHNVRKLRLPRNVWPVCFLPSAWGLACHFTVFKVSLRGVNSTVCQCFVKIGIYMEPLIIARASCRF